MMFQGFKTLLSKETFLLPFMVFALTKIVFPTAKDVNILIRPILHVFRIILTFIATPMIFSLLFLAAIYFEFITLVARYYFGEEFHSNVLGADVSFTFCTPQHKNIINFVNYIKDGPAVPEKMMEMFRNTKKMDVILKNHPELSCVRKSFMGYSFLVKTTVEYEDIIRNFDDYNTYEQFQEFVNRVTKTELPYDGEYSWEVLIGKKPIQVHCGELHYPIMFRFHHSLTDGMGMLTFLVTSFAKNGVEQFDAKCEQYNQVFANYKHQTMNNDQKPQTWIKILTNTCRDIVYKDFYYHFNMINAEEQPNILLGTLTGEKIIAYSFEGNDEKFIEKIKETKKALKVSFDDVVLGAVTASLSEYYKKRGGDSPSEITTILPHLQNQQNLQNVLSFNSEGEPITKFVNNLFSIVELPVDVNLLDKPKEIIAKINKTKEDIAKSMDFTFFNWMLNVVFTIIPGDFTKIAIRQIPSTVIITRVPGMKRFTYENDCCADDMVAWTHHMEKTGVLFSFIIFDDRLRVAVDVDRGIVDNVQEVQALCDGVLRFIRSFYEDICNSK